MATSKISFQVCWQLISVSSVQIRISGSKVTGEVEVDFNRYRLQPLRSWTRTSCTDNLSSIYNLSIICQLSSILNLLSIYHLSTIVYSLSFIYRSSIYHLSIINLSLTTMYNVSIRKDEIKCVRYLVWSWSACNTWSYAWNTLVHDWLNDWLLWYRCMIG